LQTGVVDGAENNPPSFYFDNHYQAAKYYTLTERLIAPENSRILTPDLGHTVEGRSGADQEAGARSAARRTPVVELRGTGDRQK
jgi:hypothetical protein